MFNIQGDEILFQGVKFATIEEGIWPTQRDRAQEQIEGAADWEALTEEHEREVNEAYRQGYAEAEEIMQRELSKAEGQIERLKDEIESLEQDISRLEEEKANAQT